MGSLAKQAAAVKVSAPLFEEEGAVLIIGFGQRKTQQLGTIGLMDCPRCGNTSEWPIHRERTYFSLFFIPLIPYNTRYLLSCPVCRESREISSEEKDRYMVSNLGR